jgi:hypothetical protein
MDNHYTIFNNGNEQKISKDNNPPHDAAPLDRPRDCTQLYNPCIANAPDVLWFSEA